MWDSVCTPTCFGGVVPVGGGDEVGEGGGKISTRRVRSSSRPFRTATFAGLSRVGAGASLDCPMCGRNMLANSRSIAM